MATEIVKNSNQKFHCESCDYKTCKSHHFKQHLSTLKHTKQQKQQISNIMETENSKHHFQCQCGKYYNDRTGLWRHKKKCEFILSSQSENQEKEDDVIMTLIKENKELKEFMVEQNTEFKNLIIEATKNNVQNSIVNNNHTNSHNKTFNLNVFLNETCKNAMNIMDFVENVTIKLSDLENVGKLGYVDGITNIIVKNLKEMDISKRPFHCSDVKREILYVKDQDKWTKENEDKDKIREAIKHIAHKNVKMIPEWKQKNPSYYDDEGRKNDEYMKIVMESMGGSDKKEDMMYENKIIKNISKTITIDKESF
jgi:hypothetical protein